MTRPASLADTLRKAGAQTVLLGDEILAAPFCGRVLAIGPGGGENAIWVNPALDDPASAERFLSGAGWPNHGGDRIWISPEIETHVADPQRMMESYNVPPAVDPGAYEVVGRTDDEVTFRNACTVTFMRARQKLELQWTVAVSRLTSPPVEPVGNVIAAGYRTRTTLRHDGRLQPGVHPAIWRLLQVRGGGVIRAPTKGRATAMTFFGEPVVDVDDTGVRCRVSNPVSSKFGIAVEASRGVFTCREDQPDRSDLIVRQFDLDPGALYSDVPCSQPDARGHAVQVYVDDGAHGGFGELEHHSAALDGASGIDEVSDQCDTWVFRGPASTIDRVQVAVESSV